MACPGRPFLCPSFTRGMDRPPRQVAPALVNAAEERIVKLLKEERLLVHLYDLASSINTHPTLLFLAAIEPVVVEYLRKLRSTTVEDILSSAEVFDQQLDHSGRRTLSPTPECTTLGDELVLRGRHFQAAEDALYWIRREAARQRSWPDLDEHGNRVQVL